MAIHAVCEFCRHKINVPDKMKGKRIACPGCGKKTRLLTALELDVEKARKEEVTAPEDEIIKREDNADEPAVAAIEHNSEQKQAAPLTRFHELRVLRNIFVFLSYLVGVMMMVVGLVVFLKKGAENGMLALVGFFLGAIISFCFLRFVAESARLGAELGDMEARMLQLLLEMRDRLDNLRK